MGFDELRLVEWIAQEVGPQPILRVGIGDDMAVVSLPGNELLFACDLLLDGVHFDSSRHDLRSIGRKAVARNLSDCAAMAVRPVAITVAAAFPRSWPEHNAQELFRGILSMAREHECAVAGGDTSRWDSPLALDVSIVGQPFPDVPPISRSGAKPGDYLYVTGKLGGSPAGRHLEFSPRIEEARQLAVYLGRRLHAMMDISDGLSLDVWRMCRASGVGALLDEEHLVAVAHEDALAAARTDNRPTIDHVLSDGEDYELLLAVEEPIAAAPVPLHLVGRVTSHDLVLAKSDGELQRLSPSGYIH